MHLPVADLHCDLLSFMAKVPKADPFDPDQIACAFPWLKAGGVRAQVMAIYTDVHSGSMELASQQAAIFVQLLKYIHENYLPK
jgi:microsomal dipeptidase-like Zn-dependent dipeptidase